MRDLDWSDVIADAERMNVSIEEIEAPMVAESAKHHHVRMLEKLLDNYRRGLMTSEEYLQAVAQEIVGYVR